MKKKLSDEDISVIIERYLNGDKMIDIAKEYDISQTTLSGYLKKNNVPSRRKFYAGYT
jgi:transposase-like protein